MKPKVLIFDKHCIVKNIFHRCKKPINIKKIHMVIKVHQNTLLDMVIMKLVHAF